VNGQPIEILLVEDQPDDVRLAMHAFRTFDIADRVHVLQDGAEAIAFLLCTPPYEHRATHEPPRLVLLDLHLPKVDGLEVLRCLKSDPRTQRIPIVVLTSSRQESDLLESYRLGANSYIVKPVDFEVFLSVVRELGRYWLVRNELPCDSSDLRQQSRSLPKELS